MNINKLNKLIASSKLSKDKIAELSGISRATLFNALNGTDIKVSTLVSLAKTLGVTVGYLLDETPCVTISPSVEGDCNQNIGNYTVSDPEIALLKAKVDLLNERIREKDAQLQEKDAQIKEKDAQIKEKDAQIRQLLEILKTK